MFFFASELKNLLSSTNKVSNSITRIKNKKKNFKVKHQKNNITRSRNVICAVKVVTPSVM